MPTPEKLTAPRPNPYLNSLTLARKIRIHQLMNGDDFLRGYLKTAVESCPTKRVLNMEFNAFCIIPESLATIVSECWEFRAVVASDLGQIIHDKIDCYSGGAAFYRTRNMSFFGETDLEWKFETVGWDQIVRHLSVLSAHFCGGELSPGPSGQLFVDIDLWRRRQILSADKTRPVNVMRFIGA